MSDNSTTHVADQQAVINGFDRLAAATQTPQTPASAPPAAARQRPPSPTATIPPTTTDQPAAPTPANGTPTRSTTDPQSTNTSEPTQYRHHPHLLPEHALLGSLLHAPAPLDQLEDFLSVRDFSTPETRAVYATLRGLHQAGALHDVATLPTESQRLHAANQTNSDSYKH
jgi:hypothetical protein